MMWYIVKFIDYIAVHYHYNLNLYVRTGKMTDIMQVSERRPSHSPTLTQDQSNNSNEVKSSTLSKKYTLTGLIKSIESELSGLITSKKQS